MKLSFSTRGWSDLNWEELLDSALDMKFTGIEIYNLFKNPEMTDRGGPFHKHKLAATIRQLRDLKLCIPCLDTSIDLSDSSADMEAIIQTIGFARDLKVPYAVVWASQGDETGMHCLRSNIERLLPIAEEQGVCLLIKTSGIFADTARLRTLLESYASDWLGALWDMHHPYRDFGESADTTIKNLGTYVKHVHLRDSDDRDTYNLIGEGNMPVGDMMRALSSINYDSFISLEWKPEWMEDLQDREIIFSHFVNYMSRFNNPRTRKKSLYYNHDGRVSMCGRRTI